MRTTKTSACALLVVLAAATAVALSGCAGSKAPSTTKTPSSGVPSSSPGAVPGGPSTGTQLAPGVYDQQDGTVRVVGTLEYRDVEGGTWLITDGTKPVNDPGKTLAVIANAAQFIDKLQPLKDGSVNAVGKKLDGVSTRMAGPEIELISIEAASEGGPAQ